MTAPANQLANWACHGKEPYVTKSRAYAVIARRKRRAKHRHKGHHEERREIATLEPYKCRFCNHWHIGTTDPVKRGGR